MYCTRARVSSELYGSPSSISPLLFLFSSSSSHKFTSCYKLCSVFRKFRMNLLSCHFSIPLYIMCNIIPYYNVSVMLPCIILCPAPLFSFNCYIFTSTIIAYCSNYFIYAFIIMPYKARSTRSNLNTFRPTSSLTHSISFISRT